MSRWALTSIQLFAVICGAAFGIYLAAHSHSAQVGLERAYSAHLEELSQRLRNMAYRDAVTGLYNHDIRESSRRGNRAFVQPACGDPAARNGHLSRDQGPVRSLHGREILGLVGEVIDRQIRTSDIGARYAARVSCDLPNTSGGKPVSGREMAMLSRRARRGRPRAIQFQLRPSGVPPAAGRRQTANELIERADDSYTRVKRSERRPPAAGAA